MEESTLYDLLDNKLISKWREAIETTENEAWFFVRKKEVLKELETELNEKSRKLLASYSLAAENKNDYVCYNINVKILNFGIKIGMELQKAFAEHEQV